MNSKSGCRRFALPLFVFVLLLLALPVVPARAQGPAPEVACPDCNDFNSCTVDACDTTTGTCRHDPLSCDDHNPCTNDVCPGQGSFGFCNPALVPAGTVCDDGSSCTTADACSSSGVCTGNSRPAGFDCDDGNSCTTSDTCDGGSVCAGIPSAP